MHRREEPDPSPGPDRADTAPAVGLAERQTHDYIRNATTTLFAALEVAALDVAALEVATGRVEQLCLPRRNQSDPRLTCGVSVLVSGV